jgi:hypothetical protein
MTDAAFSSAVREITPGQRAHRRWHETRWPDSTPGAVAGEWEILSARAAAAWEAAAIEGSAPELAGLRRLLGEISALAASAIEGGEPYWRVVEEIAARVAAAGIPDGAQGNAGGTGRPGNGEGATESAGGRTGGPGAGQEGP